MECKRLNDFGRCAFLANLFVSRCNGNWNQNVDGRRILGWIQSKRYNIQHGLCDGNKTCFISTFNKNVPSTERFAVHVWCGIISSFFFFWMKISCTFVLTALQATLNTMPSPHAHHRNRIEVLRLRCATLSSICWARSNAFAIENAPIFVDTAKICQFPYSCLMVFLAIHMTLSVIPCACCGLSPLANI